MHGMRPDDDRNVSDLEERSEGDIHGPSQADIDRSWEGYEVGVGKRRSGLGNILWKTSVVVVSIVVPVSYTHLRAHET